MSDIQSPCGNQPKSLIDLLEDIVASYRDNDSRPADALSRYRQRVQRSAGRPTDLARRFVVIEGGARHRPTRRYFKLNIGQPHLRLILKTMCPVDR